MGLGKTMARGVASVCAMAACAVLALMPAPGGVARADDAFQWPTADAAVQEAWKAGITGKGVKVAVIDTLATSDEPSIKDADVQWHNATYVDFKGQTAQCVLDGWTMPSSVKTGDTVHSSNNDVYSLQWSHGNDVLMALAGNGVTWDGQPVTRGTAPGVTVDFYAKGVPWSGKINNPSPCTSDKEGGEGVPSIFAGPTIDAAVGSGSRIVSMSVQVLTMDARDYQGTLTALRHGVVLLAGAPNEEDPKGLPDRTTGIPGPLYGAPGVVGVGDVGSDGSLYPDAVNGGVQVTSPGYGVRAPVSNDKRLLDITSGTSWATPTLAGYLALAMQKWPDATGNQILQSLVRTTKEAQSSGQMAKNDVWRDEARKRGFGQVDAKALLDTDPTQYPDINPILEMQLLDASDDKDAAAWYGQDCATDPDGIAWTDWQGQATRVPCEWGEFKKEYERQKSAWEQVKQCKADGGSDCMQYSATATAPKDDAGAGGAGVGGSQPSPSGSASPVMPVWVWWAGGAGVVVVLAGVGLAVVLSRRGAGLARAAAMVGMPVFLRRSGARCRMGVRPRRRPRFRHRMRPCRRRCRVRAVMRRILPPPGPCRTRMGSRCPARRPCPGRHSELPPPRFRRNRHSHMASSRRGHMVIHRVATSTASHQSTSINTVGTHQ